MDLFKVTCVTCHARLAVRDESAIGKIVACPRCGSMVQIARPANPAAAGGRAAPLSAIPQDGLPAPGPAPLPPDAAFTDAAALVDADAAAPVDAAGAAPATPSPLAAGAGAPVDATAAAASGRGSFAWLGIVAGAGLAGAGLVAVLVSWFGRPETPAPTLPAAAPSVVQLDPHASSDAPSIAKPTASDQVSEVAEPLAPPNVAPVPLPDPQLADAASQIVPSVPSPDSTEQRPNDSGETDAAAARVSPPPIPPPAAPADSEVSEVQADKDSGDEPRTARSIPRLVIDPLDVDPEGLDLSTLLDRPPPKLNISGSDVPAKTTTASDAEPPPAPVDSLRPFEPRIARANASPALPTDPATLLARKYPAITAERIPLCRLLDLATQFSGLPVSVSPDQLRLAGVSAAAPASLAVTDATLEEMLAEALRPLRLEPHVDGSQVVLRRAGLKDRRTILYPVDDLAADAHAVERLAGWVRTLVAPESWSTAGGAGVMSIVGEKLRVENREDVQYEVLLLLERYRLARGLPLRSKYPAALLAPATGPRSLDERLAAPTTFTFTGPTPLREIFRYWQEQQGVAVLVDWPAVAEQRLWPNTQLSCSANAKPWSAAMDAVLHPLGLGWRVAGPRCIEITSLEKVNGQPQLEAYRLSDAKPTTSDELATRIQALAAIDVANENSPAPQTSTAAAAMAYDADRRVLLVRQPAGVQRRLASWLSAEGLIANQ